MADSDNARGQEADAVAPSAVPLSGRRAQAVQRLQIGLIGLAAMLLMVTLANVVMERAKQSDAAVVPEAVDPGAVPAAPAPMLKDPLVDAGVVPNLPSAKKGANGAQSDGNDASR